MSETKRNEGPAVKPAQPACEHAGHKGYADPEHCQDCAVRYAEIESAHWARY